MTTSAERELKLILEARESGTAATIATYTKLSGPGWLQGAITLGGGSLAGSLYLGVVMGYELMWLQPVAMILGVIMLSAISYVTLSTGQRPFQAINEHISPLLGWGWLIATVMANIVWCLPQFALGTAAIQQNLAPSLNNSAGKVAAAVGLLVVATVVVWFYNSGNWGIKLFEIILKLLVGVVVLSFFGVVIAMTLEGALPWGNILGGLVPRPSYLFNPVPSLEIHINATGAHAGWWHNLVATTQKDNIITAFATAVGINMTFLLPYSMLRKGWGRDHRGLAIFDLSIGLIVPFVLATGCVVIASASQFHGHPEDVFAMLETGKGKEVGAYNKLLDKRLAHEMGSEFAELQQDVGRHADARKNLPEADRRMAGMLAARDNLALAKTLQPLVGQQVAQKVFGIGVVGMALSTIIILMLINGFAFCEMLGVPAEGKYHRIGSLFPAIGILGPFVWSKAAPALATPTSVFGGAMLPIAYVSFFLLMNCRSLLGEAMPRGASRWRWNILMLFATLVASFASAWGLIDKSLYGFPIGKVAIVALLVLFILGLASFIAKHRKHVESAS
ncbi:MAG: divalent metal cation transporter [Planctomycetes bacterium]|nr:divalent metal cation transporter [Planctomycetota bacterium]